MGRRADRDTPNTFDDVPLTEEEERGVELALEQYRKGQTISAVQARRIFDSLLER